MAQGIKPNAKKLTVLATVAKTDVSIPPGPGGCCWFCGSKDHQFRFCETAKELSGKTCAEKGLGPPPPPPAKLSRAEWALKHANKESKSGDQKKETEEKSGKKRLVLDLSKKEQLTANTTVVEKCKTNYQASNNNNYYIIRCT